MIKQRRIRSCGGRRARLFRLIAGTAILATTACAEVEFGSEVYKNFTRTDGPPAQPVISSSARPDAIDPSLHADPEAFHATGLALWDGERTLAGIWIAHSLAQVARRVRVTNNETGTRVDAAMFRRDPNLSGPRIIVSSEAAEHLGLSPGLGTQITIDGLAYSPADTAVATGPGTGTVTEPVSASADVQTNAVTAGPAAIEVSPVADLKPTSPATGQTTPKPVSAAAAPDADSGDGYAAAPIPDAASSDDTAGTGNTGSTQQEAEIVTTPEATAPAPVPLPRTRPVAPAPAPENKSATALEAPGDITDGRHFIQAGVFGEPENATRLVNKLRAAKLPAKEMPLILGERQFTRVVIGPYQTVAGRNAALDIVRRVGPADAALVRG